MRWLTRRVRLRVVVAAIAVGEVVLAMLYPSEAPLVGAGIVAGIVTIAAAWFAARSVSVPLEQRTERAVAERRTAQVERDSAESERERLAGLLDELGEAILIADSGGRIERANVAAAGLFGPSLKARRLVEVVHDHEILELIANARADGETVAQVERANPARFHRAIARRLADGRLLLVVQDLTAMRQLETIRSDFVANVTHELRTPIASLKSMVETLQAGALGDPDAANDFLGRIGEEVDELAQLVEDLLVLARVESGEERFAIAPTPPADLLARAAERMGPLLERAAVRLIVEPARDAPSVAADRDRVGQVLANLLHNAARHTSAGGEVHLSAARSGDAVVFRVRDTGDGIAADDLGRIFERFYKGDRSRASGGTGLGLSIAKHIVEAQGGTIGAQSDGPGRGATFTFTLPVARR